MNDTWRHEIVKGHLQEVGMLAVEHFEALHDQRRAETLLIHARRDNASARAQLIVDEFRLQHA